ncbi:hypothetical protein EDD75_1669 [Thermodesulfitimonas autotrophica]|uniref:Uncharacterized protein n=1 Tax=Thermodesulfitimonas autotrophica TaxID=1894989 RepID=A0A3N5AZG1_9THEO|nr:hypothetical protein EDD75_1669 [Thermodesulfitimonas autotrophica]
MTSRCVIRGLRGAPEGEKERRNGGFPLPVATALFTLPQESQAAGADAILAGLIELLLRSRSGGFPDAALEGSGGSAAGKNGGRAPTLPVPAEAAPAGKTKAAVKG